MNWKSTSTFYTIATILIIVLSAAIPLFFDLPFRDNIYLSWEGAYRMYNGYIPFKDFGIPLGYAYWILPTISFHIFGPYLFSLVKIQVVINIISGLAFWSMIRKFSGDLGVVTATVLLYVISFSFYNFWPWYNHTVIVFEFVSLALLITALVSKKSTIKKQVVMTALSAFFCFLSLFTKQDGGAFALLICAIILIYYTIQSGKWGAILTFGIGYLVSALVFITPLLSDDFGYWFNYGQEPHYSRINMMDFMSAILGGSNSLKLYFLLILLIVFSRSNQGFDWLRDQKFVIHLLLTLGIWLQAAILQVTSYVPADGNVYYHSFMFFFILNNANFGIQFNRLRNLVPLMFLILFWWSGLYWKYTNRMFASFFSSDLKQENVVSNNTFVIHADTTAIDISSWKLSGFKEFDHIKLPREVIKGISKIKEWYSTQPNQPKVLNMSELTPLASILGYKIERGIPLWYHLNVGMFRRELDMFLSKINNQHYDLVLFENIPHLNNFYPFEVRESLKDNYELFFSFQAPRDMTTEVIEVYIKRNEKSKVVQLDQLSN